MLVENLERLYREEAEERLQHPNNPFRASAAGHCIRKGCFDLLGLKGKALQPRRIAVFKHGDWTHDNLTADLKQALGWRFVEGMDFKDNFVEIDGAKISYHIDGAFQHEYEEIRQVNTAIGGVAEERVKKTSLGIVEIKSMSDFAFDRARKGEIDREYLAQAWVYWKGTDFNPVVFICYRKETSHMVEIVFDRQAPEKIVTQRLTGDPIELAKQDPLMVTEIRTPFDPSVEDYVRERIKYLKTTQELLDHYSLQNTLVPLLRQIDAQETVARGITKEVPGADAVEDEVIKVQGKNKRDEMNKTYGQFHEANGSWYSFKTGRRIVGFPCNYCGHMERCFPDAKMEMSGNKPIWVTT